MSNLRGNYKGHTFHGAPERFEVVAEFINSTFGKNIKYIADVAGGQGMLSRILRKKFNYEAEVIDPRGFPLVGVPNVKKEYSKDMAGMYDLIVGLHPDEATKEIVYSAFEKPTLLIPCCNFWDNTKKLGTKELVESICNFYTENNIQFEKVELPFKSIKNIALITRIKTH